MLTQEDGFDKAIIYHLVACTPYGSSTSADLARGLTLAGTDCPQLKVKLLAPPGPVTFSVSSVVCLIDASFIDLLNRFVLV